MALQCCFNFESHILWLYYVGGSKIEAFYIFYFVVVGKRSFGAVSRGNTGLRSYPFYISCQLQKKYKAFFFFSMCGSLSHVHTHMQMPRFKPLRQMPVGKKYKLWNVILSIHFSVPPLSGCEIDMRPVWLCLFRHTKAQD